MRNLQYQENISTLKYVFSDDMANAYYDMTNKW